MNELSQQDLDNLTLAVEENEKTTTDPELRKLDEKFVENARDGKLIHEQVDPEGI